MSGPPKDVEASELFLKLLQRPRPSEPVPFPALDEPGARGEIRIQVLSKEDHDRARIMAHASLKKNAARYGLMGITAQDMLDPAIKEVVADLAACEVLAMACVQVKPMPGQDESSPRVTYGRVFADGEAVGKVLSADEVAYLFSAYTMVQHRYGPHEEICLPEDLNEWVRRLKEGAADHAFLRLSSPQWAELLTLMAARLYDLSGTLISQWQSLPESLRSALQMYCLDTGSSGEPVETSYEAALPSSEISFEQALRFANQNFRKPTTE